MILKWVKKFSSVQNVPHLRLANLLVSLLKLVLLHCKTPPAWGGHQSVEQMSAGYFVNIYPGYLEGNFPGTTSVLLAPSRRWRRVRLGRSRFRKPRGIDRHVRLHVGNLEIRSAVEPAGRPLGRHLQAVHIAVGRNIRLYLYEMVCPISLLMEHHQQL